jgi:nucleotide-binding universal stress UspA family protein
MPLKIDRILCPVDLTVERDAALRYAFALARGFEAKLYVCYCTTELPATTQPAIHKELNEFVARVLDVFVSVPNAPKVAWESVVVEAKDAAQGIRNEAARRAVNLIVMCSRRRPMRHALLGSVAEAVCRAAPCPVLVTHPNEREWVGATTGEIDLRRVAVAHDFSDYSELALQYGLAFAQEFQAELHLLHAIPTPVLHEPELAWTQETKNGLYHKTARELQQAVPGEAHLWCNVTTAVRWGKPFREVLAYAKEQEIDLIAMGAHGSGFGAGTLFGSNVDRVLRQADCPVLVARPMKPKASGDD